MNIRELAQKQPTEGMSNLSFRLMSLTFDLVDLSARIAALAYVRE